MPKVEQSVGELNDAFAGLGSAIAGGRPGDAAEFAQLEGLIANVPENAQGAARSHLAKLQADSNALLPREAEESAAVIETPVEKQSVGTSTSSKSAIEKDVLTNESSSGQS